MWPLKKKEWKFIGSVTIGMTRTFPESKTLQPRHYEAIINFYMNDNGDRKVEPFYPELKDAEEYAKNHPLHTQSIAWVGGGPFPKDFIPIDDVLGDMLRRLVDRKLAGGQNGR